ncbi:MAG: DEAD/DEAH box helicase [Candidatus Woesearchaeota archaeon]
MHELLPAQIKEVLAKLNITEFRPAQKKAIGAGLFEGKNLLVCTPTASGKTLIAEMAAGKSILEGKGKAVYIVPLVALASEKAKDFKKRYGHLFKVALSVGDFDSSDPHLMEYDLIICTAEKLDSLIRHHAPWLRFVSVVIVDEVHLLNDVSRGPTLEILITLLKKILPGAQIIALSATIGNPEELAKWLDAKLVKDNWRPVPLHKGVYFDNTIEFE